MGAQATMATSDATAPILEEARGLVARIQRIDQACHMLTKGLSDVREATQHLAPEDAVMAVHDQQNDAHAALQARRRGG